MQIKGQAGNAVFRSLVLLAKFSVIQNWLLQIPIAPDCGRYCLKIMSSNPGDFWYLSYS